MDSATLNDDFLPTFLQRACVQWTSLDPHIGKELAKNTPHCPFKINGYLADIMSNRKQLQDRL